MTKTVKCSACGGMRYVVRCQHCGQVVCTECGAVLVETPEAH